MDKSIFTFQGSWHFKHNCNPLKTTMQGPFPTKEEADKALEKHKAICTK